jgi:hypothetical protein
MAASAFLLLLPCGRCSCGIALLTTTEVQANFSDSQELKIGSLFRFPLTSDKVQNNIAATRCTLFTPYFPRRFLCSAQESAFFYGE